MGTALSVSCADSSPTGGAKFLATSLRGGAKPRRGNPYPTQKTNPLKIVKPK